MKKKSALISRLRTTLSCTVALWYGALLPAAAHTGGAPVHEAEPGAWLTLGLGLLLLLLRPRARQPAYALFAHDAPRPAEPLAVQHPRPHDYRPQRIKIPLAV